MREHIRACADPQAEAEASEWMFPILEWDASSTVLGPPLKVGESPL